MKPLLLDSVPGPYSVEVVLFSIPNGADLLFANMTLLGSVSIPLTTAVNPAPPALGVAKIADFTGLPAAQRTIDDPIHEDLVMATGGAHVFKNVRTLEESLRCGCPQRVAGPDRHISCLGTAGVPPGSYGRGLQR